MSATSPEVLQEQTSTQQPTPDFEEQPSIQQPTPWPVFEEQISTQQVLDEQAPTQQPTTAPEVIQQANETNEEGKTKAFEVDEVVTDSIQEGRKQGWSIYNKFAFPLVNDIVRDFWVMGELSILVLSFILSLVSFAGLNNREVFNVIHLVLTIIASILAGVDAFFQLKDFRSCRAAVECYRKGKQEREKKEKERQYNVENPNQTDDSTELEETVHETAHSDKKQPTKCQLCLQKFKDKMDIIRILASEAIFYPILICDLFEFIASKGYESGSHEARVSFALFLLSCTGVFLYVYLSRVLILASVVYNVYKQRKKLTAQDKQDQVGLGIQVYFAIHVFLQMIAQILMVIAIGAKISYENRSYNPESEKCTTDSPPESCFLHASSRLWYMFIAAYFMPVCGILTFYIVCYYWITELPIGVCLDFLSMLEAGSCDSFLHPKESTKEVREKGKNILCHYYSSIWRDFEKMYNVKFIQKLTYPFKNPLIIVLCITYATLQLAFIVCAGVSSASGVILNEGIGWIVFYLFAVAMGGLANIYVFIIAYFWILIITLIIMLIILYLLCKLCEICQAVDDFMKCKAIPTPGRLRSLATF